MKKSFFNNFSTFSFKDLMACMFSAPFIVTIVLYMILHNAADLELIKTLIPVEIVVLGGYFGQEVASSYFTRGSTGYGMYGSYSMGYNYGVGAPISTTTQSQDLSGSPI